LISTVKDFFGLLLETRTKGKQPKGKKAEAKKNQQKKNYRQQISATYKNGQKVIVKNR
jgi:hypothetical protein